MTVVPVFLYHSVSTDPPSWIAPFTVTPNTFSAQLAQIAASGLTIIPLRQLVSALRGGPPVPDRSCVLTFDDGFADFYWTVAPVLSEKGLPATLYVTTGAIHPPGGPPSGSALPPAQMLNWRQVTTLDALGVEIGGHTRTHPQLDTLPAARLHDEIVDSKKQLEDAVSHQIHSFAYPHGYSSAAVRRKVAEAGYSSAAAVRNALSSPADEPLRIARLMVMADTSAERFAEWTRGRGAPAAPMPESVRTRAWRMYRRARAAFGTPPGGPQIREER
ncbi:MULTISPECIES: polysaccharide deacetylase family protein [Kitasatospora]|uniref:Peptidoglycan/xylan/chitin deacetylase (PgdA/CDA1 family) n=2 Tax=Kitasatospora TaxID=2063 RepID=A0ABT1IU05_9ACTN|nr:polysaccharide deacetylase family protein [Kitasatospora paracochleata]MCP2308618.1 peptidoglycan/xylan/chitin deacetylase (PgdA/CDA1 family) [Kitasatospora paracochleata]